MKDTPETDAANTRGVGYAQRFYAMKAHARKLERERDEARDAAEKAKAYKRVLKQTNAQLKRERDEHRKLADDAMATLHEIKVKYGLGERHVMQEKDREIDKLHKIIDEMEILNRVIG